MADPVFKPMSDNEIEKLGGLAKSMQIQALEGCFAGLFQ